MKRQRERSTFRPVLLVDRQISDLEDPVLPGTTADGRPYESVQILVFDDRGPVGQVSVDLPDGGLTGDQVGAALQRVTRAPSEESTTNGTDEADPFHACVVVATKDRQDQLRRCLTALDGQDYADFDVVVVDNDAWPSAQAAVGTVTVKGRPVRYVHESIPGLANAHNAALPYVDSPVVAFTDDDVEPDPGWLSAIVNTFVEFPNAACVTGLIYPASLDYEAQFLVEHLGLGKAFARRVFDLSEHRPESALFPYAIGECGSGANMAFRTDVLRAVGGFDGALGTGSPGKGGDDLAAFFDVIVAGHALVYEPSAVVRHHHDPNKDRFRRQIRQYGTGLGAYLTRCAVRNPDVIPKMVRGIPAGLRHMAETNGVGRDSRVDLPLTPRIAGLATGPVAYLRGRRALSSTRRG